MVETDFAGFYLCISMLRGLGHVSDESNIYFDKDLINVHCSLLTQKAEMSLGLSSTKLLTPPGLSSNPGCVAP